MMKKLNVTLEDTLADRHCGNELFYVTANGYYCPNCGLNQKGF